MKIGAPEPSAQGRLFPLGRAASPCSSPWIRPCANRVPVPWVGSHIKICIFFIIHEGISTPAPVLAPSKTSWGSMSSGQNVSAPHILNSDPLKSIKFDSLQKKDHCKIKSFRQAERDVGGDCNAGLSFSQRRRLRYDDNERERLHFHHHRLVYFHCIHCIHANTPQIPLALVVPAMENHAILVVTLLTQYLPRKTHNKINTHGKLNMLLTIWTKKTWIYLSPCISTYHQVTYRSKFHLLTIISLNSLIEIALQSRQG